MFERRIAARKFAKYDIDVFADEVGGHVGGTKVEGYENLEAGRGSAVA
jgi:hypothetical protein